MGKIITFVKTHAVVLIAWAIAAASVIFVPIDGEYINYFDFSTLACLFLTLLVVGAFSGIKTFEIISRKIVMKLKNTRRLVMAVVFITYTGSMILANDMALITFLPLGWLCLKKSDKTRYTAFTFIMQNVAANLGGMLTPFGNPQNLYLFSHFGIPAGEFMLTMLPPFLLSLALIVACCFFVKREPLELKNEEVYAFRPARTAVYSVLFAVSVLAVFRVFPWYYALAGVSIAVLIADHKAFAKVSYSLLLTFCAFFIISGNVARIEAVRTFLEKLTARNTLLSATLSCQVISNVPTAVLLSRFVADYAELLVAVNIGGVGTLVASLASLITFGKYREAEPAKTRFYLGLFSAINFGFLAVLLGFELILFYVI